MQDMGAGNESREQYQKLLLARARSFETDIRNEPWLDAGRTMSYRRIPTGAGKVCPTRRDRRWLLGGQIAAWVVMNADADAGRCTQDMRVRLALCW